MEKETSLQHSMQPKLPEGNCPVVAPIYQSAKFTFSRMADIRKLFDGKKDGYLYTRYGNPTLRELELNLASLQGVEEGCVFASGVSAISHTLLALLEQGDKVLMFWESYKPSRYLADQLLRKFGVTTVYTSLQDMNIVQEVIRKQKPQLVLFESPTNPCVHVADIQKICDTVHEVSGLAVLDNTFAGPREHGQFPVDLYIHSLSKHISGHSDVIAGAVLGSKALINKHRYMWIQLGACLDPHAAYLVSRGLRTFDLRFKQQCSNAHDVAEALLQMNKVKNVQYPGLTSHSQHALAKSQMQEFGQVLSFEIDAKENGQNALDRFIDSLKLFQVTGSIGSMESLVAPVELFYGGDLQPDIAKQVGVTETAVRLSIGLESPKDLIADLKQALDKL